MAIRNNFCELDLYYKYHSIVHKFNINTCTYPQLLTNHTINL